MGNNTPCASNDNIELKSHKVVEEPEYLPTADAQSEEQKANDVKCNNVSNHVNCAPLTTRKNPGFPNYCHLRRHHRQKKNRITLNVGGFRFQTFEKTLARFPESLLGNSLKRMNYYFADDKEYFFDRNRQAFEAILYFYQSQGRLLCPSDVPMEIFLEEIQFFQLGEEAEKKVTEIIEKDKIPEEVRVLPKNKYQSMIWELFDNPDSGYFAKLLSLWSVFIITLSVIILCIETLPQLDFEGKYNQGNVDSTAKKLKESGVASMFGVLEVIIVFWFTIEYLIRFITSPQKWAFLKTFLNIIDIMAILPFYIERIFKGPATKTREGLIILRLMRLVRIFRIFKLSRHSHGLQILGMTLRESFRELCLLVFFLTIGMIIFASSIYYAELEVADSDYKSIPEAFWWAIVTMTTVGYGDMVPTSLQGKLIGTCCALSGVLTLALPVPVIVSNFGYYYNQDKKRRMQQKKEEESKTEKAKSCSSVNISVISLQSEGRVQSQTTVSPLTNAIEIGFVSPPAYEAARSLPSLDYSNGGGGLAPYRCKETMNLRNLPY